MAHGASGALKQNIVSFVYKSGFAEVSPGMLSMLGYAENDLRNLTLDKIIENYADTLICRALSDVEIRSSYGSASDTVSIRDVTGFPVKGLLSLEWRGGPEGSVFGYFFPLRTAAPDGKSLEAEKISDMSVSAYVEIDGDLNIIGADKGFRFYFDLREDPVGSSLKDIKGLSGLCKLLEEDAESRCFTVDTGSDELIAVVGRYHMQTDIRLYGKDFLLYSRFPCSLPSVQARRLIWDGLPIAMLIDPERKVIVEANRSAAAFYGYNWEELRGMPVSNINILPMDVLDQELEMGVSGKKKFFIFRHRTSNGTIKDIKETVAPVELFGKTYLFAFITDITRRKNLERVIEEKNRMLTELNVGLSRMVQREVDNRKKQEQLFIQQSRLIAMSEMVGAVAHHWRQPLNTIGLLVQDLEDANSYGELDDKYIAEVVRKVMGHLHTMSQSIDNFRSLFRPSKEKNFFDVKEAIGDVVKLMQTQLKNHRITVCMNCTFCDKSPDYCVKTEESGCLAGNLFVLGYCNEFKQVVLNILTNSFEAIKTRRSSGLLLDEDEGLIFINIEKDGEWISITMDDNGGGLGDTVISRAFEPYFTTKREGFGIGLYMAKTFIESSMNGSIKVENVDDGCRVAIKVPYRENPSV